MEGADNILDTVYEDDNVLDSVYEDNLEGDDVEMVDVEEGESMDRSMEKNSSSVKDFHGTKQQPQGKNRRRRANRKKNKRKMSGSGSSFIDINRFVLETCRHLKEKKSYMVYNAVGCLGVSTLSDLVKEVDAVQACGGQMTADGRRFRTGGGILWSIIKSREPNAYKEIMRKTRDFEKQFKRPDLKQEAKSAQQCSPKGPVVNAEGETPSDAPNGSREVPPLPNPQKHTHSEGKRKPSQERLRIPVSYDDDLLKEEPKEDAY